MTSDHRHVCHGSFLSGACLAGAVACSFGAAFSSSVTGVVSCVITGLLFTLLAKFFYLQIPRR